MWCLCCPAFALESNGVISFYVRPPEVKKIVFEKVTSKIGMILKTKTAHFGGYKLSYRLEILHTGWRLAAQ